MADSLQQVSTLHKQNFDLKLELYHRRQRQEGLEARLAAAEKQLADQAELEEINEQLLQELQRRDQALHESITMIVELEAKVEKLTQDREHVRAFDADYDGGYFDAGQDDGPPSSPPRFENKRQTSITRMPSFLSETTEGADALRSLYLPSHNQSYSDTTLPKLLEDGREDTQDGMNSPRLSVLSESSFVSIYGNKQLALDQPEDTPKRHRASSSIEKWIDDRPIPSNTPQRPTPPLRKNQFLSINDVLESPLQRLEKLKHTLKATNRNFQHLPEQAVVVHLDKRQPQELRRITTDKSSFERQHTLPPTPDTIGTNTLRHYQNSNDTLAQDHKEETYLSNTTKYPVPQATYNAYQSTLSIRPRSAGETITSRREGHGWDTPTEETETGSIDGSITTFASQRYPGPKRIMTPNLFSFSGDDWGKDVMYDHELSLPAHLASRYTSLRRSSVLERPVSDNIVMKHADSVDSPQYGAVPIEGTSPPNVSDRRSSLAAATKLRKSNQTSVSSSIKTSSTQGTLNSQSTASPSMGSPIIPSFPGSSSIAVTKRSRMPSLRIFGRGDNSPSSTNAQASPQTARPKAAIRSQSYFEGSSPQYDEDDRATPPPIQRSRQVTSTYRPSSADQGAARRVLDLTVASEERDGHRRRGSVGVKNDVHVNQRETEDDSARGTGARKWFGIGGGVSK